MFATESNVIGGADRFPVLGIRLETISETHFHQPDLYSHEEVNNIIDKALAEAQIIDDSAEDLREDGVDVQALAQRIETSAGTFDLKDFLSVLEDGDDEGISVEGMNAALRSDLCSADLVTAFYHIAQRLKNGAPDPFDYTLRTWIGDYIVGADPVH